MDLKLEPRTSIREFRATNGEEYEPCDREIYRKGHPVVGSSFAKDITEAIVVELRSLGFRVDWHFYRNRIIVKTLDDPAVVRSKWWEIIKCRNFDRCWIG